MKKLPCRVCGARPHWTRVGGGSPCWKHRAKTKRRQPRIPRGQKVKKSKAALPGKKTKEQAATTDKRRR